jgi:hypothetical protein
VRHSLRNDVQPDPPVPPSTLIIARSMNIFTLQRRCCPLRAGRHLLVAANVGT